LGGSIHEPGSIHAHPESDSGAAVCAQGILNRISYVDNPGGGMVVHPALIK